MRERWIEKTVLSVAMLLWWLFLPVMGYNGCEMSYGHIVYWLSHASFWHLAGNVFVLWLMRGNLHLLPSVYIAFLCSLIPAFSIYGELGMTVGFSGVLFAIAGIKWGIYCRINSMQHNVHGRAAYSQFLFKALPFALIGIVIPRVNWCLHLYCMLAGFVYGRWRGR